MTGDNPATTDVVETGWYGFNNLVMGTYTVAWSDIGTGYQFSPVYVQLDNGVNNNSDARPSDADESIGYTTVLTLVSSESDTSWDAGIYNPVSIGNFVWVDSNGNGIQDGSEVGLDDVSVELYRDTDGDGSIDTSGSSSLDYVGTTMTGDNPATTDVVESGWYSFSGLVTGEYELKVISPVGYGITPVRDTVNNGGNDTNDSDFDPASGNRDTYGTSHTISIVTGASDDMSFDAGLVEL